MISSTPKCSRQSLRSLFVLLMVSSALQNALASFRTEKILLFSETIILLSGLAWAHDIVVTQEYIHANPGDSVSFETSCWISQPLYMWPSVEWKFGNRTIVYYSMQNGSVDTQGSLLWSSGNTRIRSSYEERIEFHPNNASLLLKDLQLQDTGSYKVLLLSFESIIEKTVRVCVGLESSCLGERSVSWSITTFSIVIILCVVCIVTITTFTAAWDRRLRAFLMLKNRSHVMYKKAKEVGVSSLKHTIFISGGGDSKGNPSDNSDSP